MRWIRDSCAPSKINTILLFGNRRRKCKMECLNQARKRSLSFQPDLNIEYFTKVPLLAVQVSPGSRVPLKIAIWVLSPQFHNHR